MLEIILDSQWACRVKKSAGSCCLLVCGRRFYFIRFNQILKAKLNKVEEPQKDIMTGFQTSYQLGIAPLLIIKDFTILQLRKVHVIVKVCRFYGPLFALHKDSNEKADYAQKATILTFKKGNIVV